MPGLPGPAWTSYPHKQACSGRPARARPGQGTAGPAPGNSDLQESWPVSPGLVGGLAR